MCTTSRAGMQSNCWRTPATGKLPNRGVNFFIRNEDGSSKLEGAEYCLFFILSMPVTAVLFVLVARNCQGDAYLHEEISEAAAGSES
jgi:hypothetical protein